ncbi:premnaspirodiene oxygenase-like [Iris pallida]|nr:premnaspirodiene oxygenase-like [Iris pallida]
MFGGGTETTSTTLTWAMAELVRNPEAMEKVQTEVRQILKGKAKIHEDEDIGELQYLKLVIKETLRLHPPLPLLLPRACGETCEMGGFTIPAGARVMINAWALGRDPGVWDDAEAFRPERFDGSSADFKGGGPRILALWFRQKNMPRDHVWARYSRARAGDPPLSLQLGAPRSNGTGRSGHDRYVRLGSLRGKRTICFCT